VTTTRVGEPAPSPSTGPATAATAALLTLESHIAFVHCRLYSFVFCISLRAAVVVVRSVSRCSHGSIVPL